MIEEVDLLVLGAGPAGIGTAVEASRHGVATVVVDEATAAGGQVYRATSLPVADARAMGPDYATGEVLRRRLVRSGVACAFGHRVWLATPGFHVEAVGPDGPTRWLAKRLVVATGATERVIAVPGWTTPGVIGLAGATVLLKAQQVLPGETTVVAGCGPLLAAVAVGILKGGGKVAAVVDLAGPADWLRALPALASRPALLARGAGWLRRIRAAGVPVLSRHAVAEVLGEDGVQGVVVVKLDRNGRPRAGAVPRVIRADALALGHGLVPSTELTRLLGARHAFHPERGGWIAERDADLRTSVPGLYVAGDGGGISGAVPAGLEGQIAGLAVARDLGRLLPAAHEAAAHPVMRKLARARHFGAAMAGMMALRPGLLDLVTPETTVCRCEDVPRWEIEEALQRGAADLNQLKSWTRCGMGPCQGRLCGETAASLVARAVGGRERAGLWTARPPLRPVPLATLTGDYSYADIPLPRPAH